MGLNAVYCWQCYYLFSDILICCDLGFCLCLGKKGIVILVIVIVIGEEKTNKCFMERLQNSFFCKTT